MPRKKCDQPWVLIDRKSGVVLRRERRRVDFGPDPLHHLGPFKTRITYSIMRLPKGYYVNKNNRYQIDEIPDGWERQSNCKDGYPADVIQPRLAARRNWARTHGHMTRFRKYED